MNRTSFLIILFFPICCLSKIKHRHPVILVPGDGGTQIEAKYTKIPHEPHFFCSSSSEKYFNVWLTPSMLLPYLVDCFVHNMILHYNAQTHTTHNTHGVSTKIGGWGDTSTVDWLNGIHLPGTKYFGDISDALVGIGYKRGVSLRGAPFDFRKAPNEMGALMTRLQTLIEDTYTTNGNCSVVLIAHSMGTMVTLFFLRQMTQAWKDMYVRAFVTLSAPWGGAIKILLTLASGINFDIPGVSPLSMRPVQRSMPSTAWRMPSPDYWRPHELLITTPSRNYTVNDYRRFFDDIGFPHGWAMRNDTEGLLRTLDAPGVTVHCLHGSHVTTHGTLHYTSDTWPDKQPTYTYDTGDGTVNIRSLKGCLRWNDSDKHRIYHGQFFGVEHNRILHDESVIKYIKWVVTDWIDGHHTASTTPQPPPTTSTATTLTTPVNEHTTSTTCKMLAHNFITVSLILLWLLSS